MDPTTKVLTWITLTIVIFFEVTTASVRSLIGNREQLLHLQTLYQRGGSRAIVKICAEPPIQRLWVYTACRIEQRAEGMFLILATYPDLTLAEKMSDEGFRVRSPVLLSGP